MNKREQPTYILVEELYRTGEDKIPSIEVIEGAPEAEPMRVVKEKYQTFFGPGTEMEHNAGRFIFWREDGAMAIEIEEFHVLGPAEYVVLDRLGVTNL